MNVKIAKQTLDMLNDDIAAIRKLLKAMPGVGSLPNGLTPESAKTPEYHLRRRQLDHAERARDRFYRNLDRATKLAMNDLSALARDFRRQRTVKQSLTVAD